MAHKQGSRPASRGSRKPSRKVVGRAYVVLTGHSVRLGARSLRWFGSIRSARDARHAAGLSLSQMAARVNAVLQTRGYGRTSLASMESPRRRTYATREGRQLKYRMPDAVRAVYVDALSEAIRAASGGQVNARIRADKTTWRVLPMLRCAVCADWFTVKRARQARCRWCVRNGQTRRRTGNTQSVGL